ncbi:hypothetical protein [Pseudonocardia humida]|uniref:Uncharacterized protein n=1 Tax=Pseudonocardia humida TaxID=2800819 RepID=A0ABT1AAH7_9PSEU|nr:hypothetical protein [Pseudonocardia humida]MCO1660022.1 hypothetical protein [Pseudonocardia humida]
MAGDRPAVAGLLLYLLIAATPTLVFWVSLRVLPALVARVAERRRSRHQPTATPLESTVADLRRLRREVRSREQRTHVRRTAVLAAYDDALLDVCRQVEVDAPLATAVGHDRVYARLITEAALEDAGIALDPPPGARRPDTGGQQ